MRVLVTGASGFVGRAVLERLAREPGWAARAASRAGAPPAGRSEPGAREWVRGPSLGRDADWRAALGGEAAGEPVDAVVHAAARVHVMRDDAPDPLAAYRAANVDGTIALAEQAAAAGVRRFVFVSSVKVHGERTAPGRPFHADQAPAPDDPYGVSKWEAEQALHAVAAASGLEVVVVRPVLVYGPGVGANFRTMLTWLHRGVPLPLGAARHNRRSLLASANLADLLVRCVAHPDAAGGTFLASDGDDLSTADLLRRTAAALGRRARLLPVPVGALRVAGGALGRGDAVGRLCDSLQVDLAPTRRRLDWSPPVSVDAALAATARDFTAHLTAGAAAARRG